MNKIKVQLGTTYNFHWSAPERLSEGSVPRLVVKKSGVEVLTVDLTHAVASQNITAINNDRRTLTLESALEVADGAYAVGDQWGKAFLYSPDYADFPVEIADVDMSGDGTTVKLSTKLPRKPGEEGVLQWASWFTEFTSADVTAEAGNDYGWTVTYEVDVAGAGFGDTTEKTSVGIIYVTKRQFQTGVTPEGFKDDMPDLADSTPASAQSRQGVINFALQQLIRDIRVYTKCAYGEDSLDGSNFYVAHTYLTAALSYDQSDPDLAEVYREEYKKALETAFACLWIDKDDDGNVEDEGGGLSGPVPLSSYVKKYGKPRGCRTFYWGMRH